MRLLFQKGGQSDAVARPHWELGAGMGIDLSDTCSLLFDYETQIFRENATVFFGSAKVQIQL